MFSNRCHQTPSYSNPHEEQLHQYFCPKFDSLDHLRMGEFIYTYYNLLYVLYIIYLYIKYIFNSFHMTICVKTPHLSVS